MTRSVGSYYGAWTSIETIDPTLLDIAYFSFFDISSDGTITSKISDDKIKSFINLKNRNKSIKLMAAIGGWNAGTTEFSRVANCKRSTFATNTLNLIKKYGFDGIDIDWEFPVVGGAFGETSNSDKPNLVNLLIELKKQLSFNGKLLTIAVCADPSRSSQAYDIRGVSENVDMVNIMTYDYGGAKGEYNAPYDKVQSSVQHWINNGCPASKLVLGLPAYGYKYSGNNKTDISYRQILQERYKWNVQWNSQQYVPFAESSSEWITFDNKRSIIKKLEIVKNNGLKGCFFWCSYQDDYDGSGDEGKFPLIRAAHDNLK